ncbi:hypothetical protein ACS0TY_000393 [Phlomoides rotata]
MLVKIGCKLFSIPNALISRIFKLNTIHMGICSSQDLIRIGIKWRIGDGNGVRLWDDPCHNDDINFYLRTLGIQNIE